MFAAATPATVRQQILRDDYMQSDIALNIQRLFNKCQKEKNAETVGRGVKARPVTQVLRWVYDEASKPILNAIEEVFEELAGPGSFDNDRTHPGLVAEKVMEAIRKVP